MASPRGGGGGCSRGSKYDVIQSFIGPDSGYDFVDRLYIAMTTAGIVCYNERHHVREVIGEELMLTIDDSKGGQCPSPLNPKTKNPKAKSEPVKTMKKKLKLANRDNPRQIGQPQRKN